MKGGAVVYDFEEELAKRMAKPRFIEAHIVGDHIFVNVPRVTMTRAETLFLVRTLEALVLSATTEKGEE